jgi:hypothetical protein
VASEIQESGEFNPGLEVYWRCLLIHQLRLGTRLRLGVASEIPSRVNLIQGLEVYSSVAS